MCGAGVLMFLSMLVFRLLGTAPVPAVTAPAGEGCVAVVGASCSYVATRAGGITAIGDNWSVEITRGKRLIHIGPGDWLTASGWFVQEGTIRPGDQVRAAAGKKADRTVGIVSVGTSER